MARDNQKKRVYDAEDALPSFASKAAERLLRNGPKVASTGNLSIEACQAYVDHITSSAWFQTRWGKRAFSVRHKVYGRATGGWNKVTLPPWARTEHIILHEMAHSLVPDSCADHGPEFAATLLTLVRYAMGAEHAATLRASYKEHRVKYRSGVASVPKPGSKPVVPRAEQQRRAAAKKAEEKAAEAERLRRRLNNPEVRAAAAQTIKQAVEDGWYGPPGSPARRQALATARTIEFPGKSKTVVALWAARDAEAREARLAARAQR